MKYMLLLISSASISTLVFLVSTGKTRQSDSFLKIKTSNSKRNTWLDESKLNMTMAQFWLCTCITAIATFALALLLTQTVLIAIVFSIASGWIPFALVSKRRIKNSREIVNAWPESLQDISASISSGQSISFAISNLAKVGPEPIAKHMKRFSILEKTLGFAPAIEIVREEMNDATTDRIIEVLIVAQSNGGRVVKEIIEDLIDSVTEDISLFEAIATESIEMKINSRAVVILPWCVLALLTFSGDAFRDFYSSSAGAFVILIGLIMSVVGILILNRLSKHEIEPRVFAYTRSKD